MEEHRSRNAQWRTVEYKHLTKNNFVFFLVDLTKIIYYRSVKNSHPIQTMQLAVKHEHSVKPMPYKKSTSPVSVTSAIEEKEQKHEDKRTKGKHKSAFVEPLLAEVRGWLAEQGGEEEQIEEMMRLIRDRLPSS